MKGRSFLTVLCASIALSACTTIGTGSGSVSPGGAPVTFSWNSTDNGITGTMSATLADNRTFSGNYRELTRLTSTEASGTDRDRGWIEWGGGWAGDWDGWSPFPEDWYTTQYSGRVVANLQAVDGQRMRCELQLDRPHDGMRGGGRGKCRLQNGRTVDAVFPPGTTRVGKG